MTRNILLIFIVFSIIGCSSNNNEENFIIDVKQKYSEAHSFEILLVVPSNVCGDCLKSTIDSCNKMYKNKAMVLISSGPSYKYLRHKTKERLLINNIMIKDTFSLIDKYKICFNEPKIFSLE
jgi:thioredoxin-related protein